MGWMERVVGLGRAEQLLEEGAGCRLQAAHPAALSPNRPAAHPPQRDVLLVAQGLEEGKGCIHIIQVEDIKVAAGLQQAGQGMEQGSGRP